MPERLSCAEVEELIASGEVGTILAWDRRSPVRYEGTWWQPPLDWSTDAFLRVEEERAEMFERMWQSLNQRGRQE